MRDDSASVLNCCSCFNPRAYYDHTAIEEGLSSVIRVVNLHKSFGANHVLRGVNLEIPDGALYAIIGGSGSGKSCLLRHLMGLLRPDQGQIWIDGVDMSTLHGRAFDRIRKRFGVLFQGGALFDSLSVYDNVAFPLREKTQLNGAAVCEKVHERLAQVGLAGADEKFPADLSGGMRKRAALARASILEPDILFFDEPTTGLDPILVNTIHQLIRDHHRLLHFTAVVVSHEIPEIFSLATHVAMLHQGVIIATGTPSDIQASPDPVAQQFINGRIKGPIDVN